LKLTHIIGTYPKLSETFIKDQIISFTALDHSIQVIAGKGLHRTYDGTSDDLNVDGFKLSISSFLTIIQCVIKFSFYFPKIYRHDKSFIQNIKDFFTIMSYLKFYDPTSNKVFIHFLTLVPLFLRFCEISNIDTPKIFTTIRGYEFNESTGLKDYEIQMVNNSGAVLLPVSERLSKICSSYFPDLDILKVYSFRDLTKYHFAPKKRSPGKVSLLIVGRLVEKKRVSELVEWLSDWKREVPISALIVHIVGDGVERKKIIHLINSLGLRDYIKYHGALPNDEVVEYMKRADILISNNAPSKKMDYEGIPNVIKEAMASGTFVVSSDDDGNLEALNNGQLGLVYEIGNKQDFYKKINEYLQMPDLTRLGILEKAKCHADTEFGYDATVKKLKKIVDFKP